MMATRRGARVTYLLICGQDGAASRRAARLGHCAYHSVLNNMLTRQGGLHRTDTFFRPRQDRNQLRYAW
jgi:hypothetical protein